MSLLPKDYPTVRRDEGAGDTYHGVRVADPYSWLEDPDSDETRAFVKAQNALFSRVLDDCGGVQAAIASEMTRLMDYEKHGAPKKKGSRWYFFHNAGLQAQSVLYSSQDARGEIDRKVVLDPNTLSEDGTIALSSYSFSEAGDLMAYSVSSGGSDWVTMHLLRIAEDGAVEKLADKLTNVKFTSMAWTHDGRGFFYNRYPAPEGLKGEMGTETGSNLGQQLWYHVVGQSQADDLQCFSCPNEPTWMIGAEVTTDGRYVLLTTADGCDPVNRLFYVDLDACDGEVGPDFESRVVKVVDNFEAAWEYIGSTQDGSITLRTNHSAPTYKLVRCDLVNSGTDVTSWPTIVEATEHVLEWADVLAGDRMAVCYLKHVVHHVEVREHATGSLVGTVPLPVGSVYQYSGSHKSSDFFVKLTSFVEPGVTYKCDALAYGDEAASDEARCCVLRRTEIPGHDAEAFVTEQVFVESTGGARVPMFVVHAKGLKRDGTAPTLLYGYGGFNISLTPDFSVKRLVWALRFGGVLCVANLRGGGEYGESWHRAGTKEQKQNVFDDFQACAQHLIDAKITSAAKLAIEGGSNGGLLVGACLNQRPDLYAAGVAAVGVMDMLRFHKFTIGHAWCTDFGCADDDEGSFQYLRAYSPLHNVPRAGEGVLAEAGTQYPSMLLLTADHDDRVVPLHSFKHVATLQANICTPEGSAQERPVVIRIEERAGHGAGKPTAKRIEEAADMLAFVATQLSATWRA